MGRNNWAARSTKIRAQNAVTYGGSTTTGDALQQWHRDVEQYPMVDDATIRDLCRRAQAGDQEARNQAVEANLRLIEAVAKRYMGHGLDLVDLIQHGTFGCMRAVAKYKHTGPHRFSTYAVWWIRSFIQGACIDTGDVVRVPRNTAENRIKVRNGGSVAPDVKARIDAADRVRDITSLDLPIANNEGDSSPLGDVIVTNEQAHDPEAMALAADERDELYRLLRLILTQREFAVIALRFGLGDLDAHTLEAVGKMQRITRERVRQIEAGAMAKLQTRLARDPDGGVALKSVLRRAVKRAA